jgi:tetratricopeptide (TPR) repeat protein
MNYDRLGFPIPPEFDRPADEPTVPVGRGAAARPRGARGQAGPGKRIILVAVLLGLIVPALVAPAVMPAVRLGVMQWSLERAILREGRGSLGAAIDDMTRAIAWGGPVLDAEPAEKSRLLCWRAMLRIENRDPSAALADATLAATIAPTAVQPQRVMALAHVIRGDADAALAAAETAVELAGPENPEALNHRAYIRALIGRELEAALADIEAALEGSGEGSPEFLDTRGFVLHLLGRQQEALADLNAAIDATQEQRRRLLLLSGHITDGELAYRLRTADHGLAVMHHHRGLACQALGLRGQAEQDRAIAEKKGFDPGRGIF